MYTCRYVYIVYRRTSAAENFKHNINIYQVSGRTVRLRSRVHHQCTFSCCFLQCCDQYRTSKPRLTDTSYRQIYQRCRSKCRKEHHSLKSDNMLDGCCKYCLWLKCRCKSCCKMSPCTASYCSYMLCSSGVTDICCLH